MNDMSICFYSDHINYLNFLDFHAEGLLNFFFFVVFFYVSKTFVGVFKNIKANFAFYLVKLNVAVKDKIC